MASEARRCGSRAAQTASVAQCNHVATSRPGPARARRHPWRRQQITDTLVTPLLLKGEQPCNSAPIARKYRPRRAPSKTSQGPKPFVSRGWATDDDARSVRSATRSQGCAAPYWVRDGTGGSLQPPRHATTKEASRCQQTRSPLDQATGTSQAPDTWTYTSKDNKTLCQHPRRTGPPLCDGLGV